MRYENTHDDLVQFLHDQAHLDDLTEPVPFVIYEPVVRTRPEKIYVGEGSRVDSFAKLEGGEGLTIGRYVHIASFAHLNLGGGRLEIGDYAAVASGARIVSGTNSADAPSMSACVPEHLQRRRTMVTRISDFACVLLNAVVLPGITLGEGAVLAACSVATCDIPAWEIWAGNPAKFLKRREVRK
jgi:galactoside O-acetyltransferase